MPAELAKPGPDGDVVLGSEKAPVTIIEYASMTCPHCAHFSTTTFPELQKRYIDTGKVRFIFREFPLDALAAAGFMLARCAGKDKFMPVVETLFAKQPDWMVQKPIEPLRAIAKQFGFTEQSFDQCLANQKVLDNIQTVRDRAATKLGVNSTPTFFVNGKKLTGDQSIDSMAKENRPLSQGRIRVFRPGAGPRRGSASRFVRRASRAREIWITPRSLLRSLAATIHSPRRCGTPDAPLGVSPQRFPLPPPQGGGTQYTHEAHAAAPDRLQVLRRTDRL